MDNNDSVVVWVEKVKVDNFMLIVPKRRDLLIKADRMSTRQYSCVESREPEYIIKEKKNIPLSIPPQ